MKRLWGVALVLLTVLAVLMAGSASFAAGTALAGSFSAGIATLRSQACRCVW